METLFRFNDVSLLLLSTACLIATALQGMHLFASALWREGTLRTGMLVYEVLLLGHLVFASMVLREACAHYSHVSIWSRSFCVPAIDASWVNVVPVAWGLILACISHRPVMAVELMVMAGWIPFFIELSEGFWPWIAAAGVAIMLFRSVVSVMLDCRRRAEHVTQFSLAEVVNTVPEGILCFKADGRIIVLNNAMRHLLEKLGCRSALMDAREMIQILLTDVSEAYECKRNRDGEMSEVWIEAPDSTKWHLAFDSVRLGLERCRRVIATDVTELMELNDELDAANSRLALMEDDLRVSLAMVDEAAELEALAHMRMRVHDVIGQRLSILHRALEDGNISRGSLNELREIIDTIMEDLAMREQIDPRSDLLSIIEAFAPIGVDIKVRGSLPNCPEVADAFVHVVREAATNAVRHAHATAIKVGFDLPNDGGELNEGSGHRSRRMLWTLSISDNGLPLKEFDTSGSGIPGMRLAIEEVGGTLYVERAPRFTVRAVVPRYASVFSEEVAMGVER